MGVLECAVTKNDAKLVRATKKTCKIRRATKKRCKLVRATKKTLQQLVRSQLKSAAN
jgi:hypothetical protein